MNQQTLEGLRFGLDLVHLACNLASNGSPSARQLLADVEEIDGALQAIDAARAAGTS